MKISFAITVRDELEIFNLVKVLSCFRKGDDDIVILRDSDGETQHDRWLLEEYRWVKIYWRRLNGDFAAQKNALICLCESADYIFQLDSDELPSVALLRDLHHVLASASPDVDCFAVPRENLYCDATEQDKMDLGLDSLGRLAYPDFQYRIFRNRRDILWSGKLHESLTGCRKTEFLPDRMNILHCKTVKRQSDGNLLYSQLNHGEVFGKGRMSYSKGKPV